MKKTAFTLFIIFLLFNIQHAYCQTPTPTEITDQNNSVEEIKEKTEIKSSEDIHKEIAVLEAQLAFMRDYNQSLLSTVYWSLGIIVAIALGLVAYNWYTNNKLYEKDKKNIKDELELELTSKFTELEKKASLEFENNKSEFQVFLNNGLENIKNNLQGELTETKDDIIRIKLDLLMQEAKYWYDRPVYVNAVTTYTKVLSTARRIEFRSYHVGIALEKLLDSLKKITDSNRPAAFQLAEIRNVLTDLPDEYDNFRGSILSSIDELLKS